MTTSNSEQEDNEAMADGWNAISTAPRDRTQVLLWSAAWEMSWSVTVGYFQQGPSGGVWVTAEGDAAENDPGYDPDAEVEDDAWLDEGWDDEANMGPTHWMAIPAPPRSTP